MKKFIRDFILFILLLFLWPFFLYKKYGAKKYKLNKNTIIVANHYSDFDALFIYLIYGKKKIYFVTINEVKKKFFPRIVCALFDCLYLDYATTNYGFFKKSIEILQSGGVICIFPEGAINPRKFGFLDFKGSFAYLAKKSGATILPLFIYPELKPFRFSKIYIGKAVQKDEYSVYKDIYEVSTFIQSEIMKYSLSLPD